MNEYYKLLIQFGTGTPVTRTRLLKLPMVTETLIDSAEANGYICRIKPTDVGEIRYVITESGKEKRDK